MVDLAFLTKLISAEVEIPPPTKPFCPSFLPGKSEIKLTFSNHTKSPEFLMALNVSGKFLMRVLTCGQKFSGLQAYSCSPSKDQ